MERVTGLEPAASSLARKRSSQMSYTRIEREHFLPPQQKNLHLNNFQIFLFSLFLNPRSHNKIRWSNNQKKHTYHTTQISKVSIIHRIIEKKGLSHHNSRDSQDKKRSSTKPHMNRINPVKNRDIKRNNNQHNTKNKIHMLIFWEDDGFLHNKWINQISWKSSKSCDNPDPLESVPHKQETKKIKQELK